VLLETAKQTSKIKAGRPQSCKYPVGSGKGNTLTNVKLHKLQTKWQYCVLDWNQAQLSVCSYFTRQQNKTLLKTYCNQGTKWYKLELS